MTTPTEVGHLGGWGTQPSGPRPRVGNESGPDFTADHLVHANDCKVSELGVIED